MANDRRDKFGLAQQFEKLKQQVSISSNSDRAPAAPLEHRPFGYS